MRLFLFGITTLIGVAQASAASLYAPISPITATASSEFTGDGRLASDTVGGFAFTTGLSAGTVTDPATGLLIPVHNNLLADMWLSNAVEGPTLSITWNLGATYKIDRAWIWNYAEAAGTSYVGRGIQSTGTVTTSTDGVNFFPLAIASNQTVTAATGLPNSPRNADVNFGGVMAQYVRFSNLNNIWTTDTYTGLAEIIFFQEIPPIPLTPEPGSVAMWSALALGGLGWVIHRRRRATA